MPDPASKAVFLSYPSQDAEAAKRICDSLRAAGIEVWFDQSELVGGDAWDQKIRGQIKACALFIPLISAESQARREGYFRLEWKLAAQRTHTIADGTPFLLPVVVDATRDADALVPEEFRSVQWTRLPAGEATPAFVARVKNLLAGPTANAAAKKSESAVTQISASPIAAKSGFPVGIVATLAVVVLGLIAFIALRPTPKETPAVPTPAKPIAETKAVLAPSAAPLGADQKSVAVLAFANMSADKDNEYFSDGLSENILDKLARVPGLRVMARASSFSYKGRQVPIAQIAQELHVGSIIEGSVQRAGQRLRVTAQLVDAADGTQVWSEQFDRELTAADIFSVQDEIALKIAARLAPTSTPTETGASSATTAAPTQNLAAYEEYLRGRSFQTRSVEFRNDAIREYQRAVALDPQFALAWAQLGQMLGYREWVPEPDQPLALHAIEEARRLGGDFFEVQVAAALLHAAQLQYDLAERELDDADRLRPYDPDALNLRGRIEVLRGHWELGIRRLRQAVELDPRNGQFVGVLGNMLRIVGRYAEAEQNLDRSFRLSGSTNGTYMKAVMYFQWKGDAALVVKTLDAVPVGLRSDLYWAARWRLLRDLGDFAGALAAVEQVQADAIENSFRPKALLRALTLESQRDQEGARRSYQEALPKVQALYAANPHNVACQLALARVYVGLERKEGAFAALREALKLANGIPGFTSSVNAQLVQSYARFGMADEAVALTEKQIATGWWKRNDLLLGADWSELRKDARFRALAEKAPL